MGYSKLTSLEGIRRQIASEREDGSSALSAKGYLRYFCSTTAFLFLVKILFTYMQTPQRYSSNKQISVTKCMIICCVINCVLILVH